MELVFFMLFWMILNKFHNKDNMRVAMKNNVNVSICESHSIIISFYICASTTNHHVPDHTVVWLEVFVTICHRRICELWKIKLQEVTTGTYLQAHSTQDG